MKMKRLNYDRRGLGGIGVTIIIAMMMVLLFVGAGAVQPMVMDQKLSPGDVFIYDAKISGVINQSGEFSYRVLSMTLTEIHVVVNDIEGNDDHYNTTWERDGHKIFLGGIGDAGPFDMMQAVFNNPGDFQKTTSFGFIGLTPMLLDVYTGNITGFDFTLTVKTKAGTFIPVYVEYSFVSVEVSFELIDTNVGWVSTTMALL